MKRNVFCAVISLFFCVFGQSIAADKFKVMTTVFPAYDFVRQIGGELVEVDLLLPPGADSHSFEPAPSDILRIQDSDLLIITGGEGDAWVEQVLSSLGASAPKTLSLVEMVDALTEELKEGMQAEEGEEEEDMAVDEHVWTSPKNAIKITAEISRQLAEVLPENAREITTRAELFLAELQELDNEYEALTQRSLRKMLIFGDRFPFRYLAEDYGLDYFAAFPGCSSEVTPSAGTLAFLIEKTSEQEVPVVLYLEFSNHEIADVIADAVGVRSEMLHSCHNVSAEDLENGVTYIELMRKNEDVINYALNGEK